MKKYSLALGGGASRGIAHIGVIKYFEENNIEIKEIAGTSMGAIIGACFAIGKNSSEMEKIISEINFLKLVDLNLSDGIISGEKIYNKLEEIYGNSLIEKTKIPLKIISTNLNSGEKKIFTSGKITDAVRASISLPSIFTPFKLEGQKYIDGGLKSNLPILELDGNDIIAISVVRENNQIKTHEKILNINFKKWFLGNTYEILKKTISIVMANNEDLSLEIAKRDGKNIILIKPDVSKYEYHDFMKYEEIIKKGYESCEKFDF